jgi:hypothetical protein
MARNQELSLQNGSKLSHSKYQENVAEKSPGKIENEVGE